MYNRYVRNDQGQYARLPQDEEQTTPPPQPRKEPPSHVTPNYSSKPPKETGQIHPSRPSEMRILNGLLDKLHLGDIDAGDLLLLVLLFLLFRENGDEELLIALGLLLIL
ncbi:MAG: hypothetical protein E7446_08515 [Ruminococcaceae bacterium]|nr:hypothetical protein [Oscillospiraceae bacterium]